MVLVLDGLVLTGRRISELCRIERQHVNVAKKDVLVYDLKNSKGKGHHGEAALIEGAWELFERRLAEIPNEPTARLFPFKARPAASVRRRRRSACRRASRSLPQPAHARQPRLLLHRAC
jgi:integrase